MSGWKILRYLQTKSPPVKVFILIIARPIMILLLLDILGERSSVFVVFSRHNPLYGSLNNVSLATGCLCLLERFDRDIFCYKFPALYIFLCRQQVWARSYLELLFLWSHRFLYITIYTVRVSPFAYEVLFTTIPILVRAEWHIRRQRNCVV